MGAIGRRAVRVLAGVSGVRPTAYPRRRSGADVVVRAARAVRPAIPDSMRQGPGTQA